MVSAGNRDMLLTKFDSLGKLQWFVQAGDTNYDYGSCVRLFGKNKLLVSGGFDQVAKFGSTTLTSNVHNTFLACYDLQGQIIWVKNFPGAFGDYITSMVIDSTMNIYVAGYFSKTLHVDSDSLISRGRTDIFLAQLNSDGKLIWLKQAGDKGNDVTGTLIFDANKKLLLTGSYQYKTTFDVQTLVNSDQNETGVFIARYTLSGDLLGLKKIGEAEKILSPMITADKNGNV